VIRLRRLAKSKGEYYVPDQPKVYFVVRLRGVNNIAPKPRKVLQLLRLLQINNGVFIKVTKATTQMLQLVEPYVTYGEPNLKCKSTLSICFSNLKKLILCFAQL